MAGKGFIGRTYGVWWKVVSCETHKNRHVSYTLVNQASGQSVTIWDETMRKLDKGLTTVSNVIHWKIIQGKGEKDNGKIRH